MFIRLMDMKRKGEGECVSWGGGVGVKSKKATEFNNNKFCTMVQQVVLQYVIFLLL